MKGRHYYSKGLKVTFGGRAHFVKALPANVIKKLALHEVVQEMVEPTVITV